MALTGSWRTEKERVLVLTDEARGREFEYELAIHLLVEVEVEAVEGSVDVAKAGLLEALREQPILPAQELVADEDGQEVEVHKLLGLRLDEARIEYVGHAGEPQLFECAAQFDGVHGRSPLVF
jgi:hypothetical protein